MGPEEIHIFFWEGAPRPPKSKCDRPKNLEVFFSQFSNFSFLGVEALAIVELNHQILGTKWYGMGSVRQAREVS